MERREVEALVGRTVALGLADEGGGTVELQGTLAEVREDGVVLSDVAELGRGPLVFCPWDNLRRTGIGPRYGSPEARAAGEPDEELHELREVSEGTPDLLDLERIPARRVPTALSLERVVPIARKATVGDVTVALVALEIFGGGLGVLSYRLSVSDAGEEDYGEALEPVMTVRSEGGEELSVVPRSGGSADGEAYGELEVSPLPPAGAVEVRIERFVASRWGPDAEEEEIMAQHPGPWTFRLQIGD